MIFHDRKYRRPRAWSNSVLRRIAPLFSGSVLNVSGWLDEDKEGGYYKNYFSSADIYSISNFGGYRGEAQNTQFQIDLEADLPSDLVGRFDVVFNHTTLEHILDVFTAVQNLCRLSKDVVIVVVPFIQEQHTSQSFLDYWRFTPLGIKALFELNGFQRVLLCSTPGHKSSIYHLLVASRFPEKWSESIGRLKFPENTGDSFFENPLRRLFRKLASRVTT